MKNYTKLKIAFVLDDSLDRTQNGVQQYILTLGQWLALQGHVVHYLVGETKDQNKNIFSLSRNIKVRFNKNILTIPLPANKKTIKKLLINQNYDILHIQMPYSPFLAGRIINLAPEQTVIIGTFHVFPYGELQKLGSRMLSLVQKTTLSRFDSVISVSSVASEFAESHFNINSLVIPNMINDSLYKSSSVASPNKIVYLGRLVERKGCMQLLKALNLIPKSILNNLEIVIAGDGHLKPKLIKYSQQHNLNINFLGKISEKAKVDLLASASLAVFPSLGGESFGIVLIEAMAAGSGVVLGGNNPGYASVLGDSPSTLFDPTDSKELAGKIQLFLSNKTLLRSTHLAQQSNLNQYKVNIVGNQILNLYKTALLNKYKS